MRSNSNRSPILSYSMAILAFLLWGTSFAVGKLIINNPLNHYSITALRTFIGTIILFVIIIAKGEFQAWAEIFKQNWWRYLLLGIGFYACAFLLEYWSLSYTKASNQAILSNTMVIWAIIVNFIFFHQKPRKMFLIGLLIAILGVFLILLTDDLDFQSSTLIGDLGTLLAYSLWGSYSAIMAKINVKTNPLYSTLSIFLCSLLLLIPISYNFNVMDEIILLNYTQWGALIYLGALCGGIAFWIYNLALSNPEISSEYIVMFSLLNPIIGVVSGLVLLQENINFREIIGIFLILVSIIIVNRSTDKSPNYRKDKKNKIQNRRTLTQN